ncbi:hypothetical protein [Halopenitus persicus]|nr:hypothetical protein [Halopenitus persicus]
MAARSPRFGIDHPTIVPTNATDENRTTDRASEDGDSGTEPESE